MAVFGFQRALETVIKKIVDFVHIVSLKASLSSTMPILAILRDIFIKKWSEDEEGVEKNYNKTVLLKKENIKGRRRRKSRKNSRNSRKNQEQNEEKGNDEMKDHENDESVVGLRASDYL